LAYLSFASFNALYNPVRLIVPKIRYMFCGTLGFHGTPVEEYWARLYFSTHTEIHFDEYKPNYIFIRFIQKCFLDPTMGFYSQVQNLRAFTKA